MSVQLTPEQAQIKAVTDVFATYYACVCSVAIWDWLSCLPSEYRLIWKSRWSGIKFLYLLIRYWGLATICAVMPSLYAQWTKEFCLGYVYVGAIMWCVTSLAGAVVLLLRCYSVWNFDKRILALLSVLLINQATWQLFNTFHTFEPLPIVGETGPCFPTPKASDGKLVLGYGTSAFCFDLTATALATYKSIQLRKRGVNQALITVILRDGILYYVAATVLYALKEAFELQTANPLIQTINAGCTLTLIPVLICRLILSLRRQGQLMTMDHPSSFSQSGVSHQKSFNHGATSGFRGNVSHHQPPMDISRASKAGIDGEDSVAMDVLRDEESKAGYNFNHSSSDTSHPYAYPDDNRMRVHVVQTTVRS